MSVAHVALACLLATGCGPRPLVRGEVVDPTGAVSVAAAIGPPPASGTIVVSGRIAEVCPTSGCWFVLREVTAGKVFELYTDLAPAGLALPPSARGRSATVKGRLVVGADRNLRFQAVGILVW